MVELAYTHFEEFEDWTPEWKLKLITAIVNGDGWHFEGSQDFELEREIQED